MPFNGSEIIDDPFNTIFSPFTDLFGTGFWLIPITFIAVALYVKTRNVVSVFAFLLAGCALLASGNIFAGYPEMAYVYILIGLLALVALVLGIIFIRR